MGCTSCLIEYWQTQGSARPVKCPYCRRQVTLLIPNWSDTAPEVASHPEEAQERRRDLEEYNALHGNERARTVTERLLQVPVLLRHLAHDFTRDPMTTMLNFIRTALRMRRLLRVCLFFLYIASPIDLMPECVLGLIGLIDDLVVLILLLVVMTGVVRAMLYAQGQRQR